MFVYKKPLSSIIGIYASEICEFHDMHAQSSPCVKDEELLWEYLDYCTENASEKPDY